jgi:hypothetical protein
MKVPAFRNGTSFKLCSGTNFSEEMAASTIPRGGTNQNAGNVANIIMVTMVAEMASKWD